MSGWREATGLLCRPQAETWAEMGWKHSRVCTPNLLFGIHGVSWDEVVCRIAALEGRGGDAHETLGVASLGTVSRSLGNVCTELRKAEAVRESTPR